MGLLLVVLRRTQIRKEDGKKEAKTILVEAEDKMNEQ